MVTALVVAAACRARPEAAPPRADLDFARTPTPGSAAPEEGGEGAPSDGGTLTRRLVGEPTTLNAVLQSSLPEAQVLQFVQRNLFDFDAGLRL